MQLHQCLRGLSPLVRKEICEEHGWSFIQSPVALATKILAVVGEIAREEKSVEKEVLHEIVFAWGERIIEPLAVKQGSSSAQRAVTWTRLRRKGVLFSVRTKEGRHGWWCPPEIRTAALSVWLPLLPTAFPQEDQACNLWDGIWNKAFLLLTLLAREPIPLTQERGISKKDMKKIEVEVDCCQKEEMEKTPWGIDNYPEEISFLLNFFREYQLITEAEGIQVVENKAVPWVSQSWSQQIEQLYTYTRQALVKERPEWDSLWRWMERQGDTCTLQKDTFTLWKQTAVNCPFHYEDWEIMWLRPLAALGWVVTGGKKEQAWWGWSSVVPPHSESQSLPVHAAYVTSDMEVWIPVFTEGALRWQLAQFADCMGGELLLTYEMNRASIRRGLDEGMSLKHMKQIITQLSGDEWRDNVIQQVTEWAEDEQRVVVEKVYMVSIEDEYLRNQLEKELSIKKIDTSSYIINEEFSPSFFEKLSKFGITPFTKTESIKRKEQKKDSFPVRNFMVDFVVEDVFPTWEQSLPEVARLPQLWISAPRTYHPQTIKKMVVAAQTLGLQLRWMDRSKEEHLSTILQIERSQDDWKGLAEDITGNRHPLRLSDIQEAQILLPW